MKKILFLLLFFSTNMVVSASVDDIVTMCNDCHGANGVSSHADVPTIAGFSETSITDMLLAFVDETRPKVMSKFRDGDTARADTSMIAIAQELSEEQIEELASHYAALTFVAAKQPFDAALAKKGMKLHENRCVKCHEDGGSSADDDAGILAGQWSEYLTSTFDHFRNDQRESEDEMIKKVKKLSQEQVTNLIHYYASLQ